MNFQLVIEIYYYVIINISYILVFIYKQLMDKEVFNILVTTYIGVSALIIALGIFAMDKGNIDKRNIFKITLIKESNINELIKRTIQVFLLILLQMILPFDILVFICRILIFYLTIKLTYLISNSFIRIINIITNEEEKQKYVEKTFIENIDVFKQKSEKLDLVKEDSRKSFTNIFSKEHYISYDSGVIFDWSNNYKYLCSKEEGKIEKIDFKNLKVLNSRIKNYVLNNIKKEEQKENDSYCIVRKLEGEKVNKKEALIYIRKEIEPLNIEYNNFYEIKTLFMSEEKIVENQIIDICQMYIDNINQGNIYGIKKSKLDFKILYETLIKEKAIYFLDSLFGNIYDLYINYKDKSKNSLIEIFYDLSYIAQENDLYMDFKNYYKLYFNLRKEGLDNNEVYYIFQNLKLTKSIIEKNDNIENKEPYFEFLLCLKQLLFKNLVDVKRYSEILERISDDRDMTIYNLNSHMNRIFNYIEYPDRYKNLDIEVSKKQEKELYNKELLEINNENIILLNITEWAIFKLQKNKEPKVIKFINDIIDKFEHYDTDDVIELYMEVKQEKVQLISSAEFWEFGESENINKCFSPKFSVNQIIFLILLKSSIADKRKLEFKEYINRKNIYIFESLKKNINSISSDDFQISNISNEEYDKKKNAISNYLQQIIDLCKKAEDEEVKKFIMNKNYEILFKDKIIQNLKELREKSQLFKFFKNINRIIYTDIIGEKFIGYSESEDKVNFIDNTELHIEMNSKNLSENLINDQEKRILKEISKQSIATNESINEIIEKFKEKENIYILTPYITNEFIKYDHKKKEYCFAYEKDNKKIDIPVIEHFGFKNEIIIGDIESFGTIEFYKVDIKKDSKNMADKYTIASFIDLANHEEIISKLLKSDNKYLPKENPGDYLKRKCNMELYQDVKYIKLDKGSLYKKKIRD